MGVGSNGRVGDALGKFVTDSCSTLHPAPLLLSLFDLIVLKDHYDYLRSREEVQRNLVEATLDRVVRWTLLEAVLLIGIASTQVLYFRRFFEKKHYL
jgi:emp24/gp25L/p24 family/GOLD